MFQYIEGRNEIDRCHKKMRATIRRTFSKTAVKDIGYPGGRKKGAAVQTDGRYWFWTGDYSGPGVFPKRRLNWFGTLREKPGVSITVEINTTYQGRSDQTAGFFARDSDTGSIYFLHSGRVGGGATGVGKKSFLTWAARENQRLVEVADSAGSVREGLIVMPIEGSAAAKSAIRYVDLVQSFKQAARSGKIKTREFRNLQQQFEDYYSEGWGRRTGQRAGKIDYVSRHGEIVDALQEWRSTKPLSKRSRIVKNILIDLGVKTGKTLTEVFEVKPRADRSSIYSAVGQLLVHGREVGCRRIIVLPEGERLAVDLVEALKRLQIEEVRFKLENDSVAILD
jgi:hypothetical protein